MKQLKALAAPGYIVHWLIAVILFYFIFSKIGHIYVLELPFYGHPIDSRVIDASCLFDDAYVREAKHGGYSRIGYYFSFLPLDLVFPLVYSALLWSCIGLIENRRQLTSFLSITVVLGAVFDYLENIFFSFYLSVDYEKLAEWVSYFTSFKTVVLIFNGLAAIFALLHWAWLVVLNKKSITKTRIQSSLILIGIACIPLIIGYSLEESSFDARFNVLALSAGVYLLVYKLITGWLFINMTLKLSAQRDALEGDSDHLAISITLSKGKIDSFWLQDIEFKISEIVQSSEKIDLQTVKPIGIVKRLPEPDDDHSISVPVTRKHGDYVMSPEEETTFSGYTVVKKNAVISIEALVVGTRPFYGLESRTQKLITWQTSIIVLPCRHL